jgi:hypothetical protein
MSRRASRGRRPRPDILAGGTGQDPCSHHAQHDAIHERSECVARGPKGEPRASARETCEGSVGIGAAATHIDNLDACARRDYEQSHGSQSMRLCIARIHQRFAGCAVVAPYDAATQGHSLVEQRPQRCCRPSGACGGRAARSVGPGLTPWRRMLAKRHLRCCFIARSISRLSSASRLDSLLSCCFLCVTSASSTLTLPSLK